MKKSFILLLNAFLIFLTFSCKFQLTKTNSVSIALPNVNVSRNAENTKSGNDLPTEYDIAIFIGDSITENPVQLKQNVKAGTTVTFEDLLLRTYTIFVKGVTENDNGKVVYQGAKTIKIKPGENTANILISKVVPYIEVTVEGASKINGWEYFCIDTIKAQNGTAPGSDTIKSGNNKFIIKTETEVNKTPLKERGVYHIEIYDASTDSIYKVETNPLVVGKNSVTAIKDGDSTEPAPEVFNAIISSTANAETNTYTTLSAALDAFNTTSYTECNITVEENATINEPNTLTINKPITLNINGKKSTITSTKSGPLLEVANPNAKVNITGNPNGSIIFKSGSQDLSNTGLIKVSSGSVSFYYTAIQTTNTNPKSQKSIWVSSSGNLILDKSNTFGNELDGVYTPMPIYLEKNAKIIINNEYFSDANTPIYVETASDFDTSKPLVVGADNFAIDESNKTYILKRFVFDQFQFIKVTNNQILADTSIATVTYDISNMPKDYLNLSIKHNTETPTETTISVNSPIQNPSSTASGVINDSGQPYKFTVGDSYTINIKDDYGKPRSTEQTITIQSSGNEVIFNKFVAAYYVNPHANNTSDNSDGESETNCLETIVKAIEKINAAQSNENITGVNLYVLGPNNIAYSSATLTLSDKPLLILGNSAQVKSDTGGYSEDTPASIDGCDLIIEGDTQTSKPNVTLEGLNNKNNDKTLNINTTIQVKSGTLTLGKNVVMADLGSVSSETIGDKSYTNLQIPNIIVGSIPTTEIPASEAKLIIKDNAQAGYVVLNGSNQIEIGNELTSTTAVIVAIPLASESAEVPTNSIYITGKDGLLLNNYSKFTPLPCLRSSQGNIYNLNKTCTFTQEGKLTLSNP